MLDLNMLIFGSLSFQKNSSLNSQLHRRRREHDLIGGELDLVGGELDQVESLWERTRWWRTRHGAKPAAT